MRPLLLAVLLLPAAARAEFDVREWKSVRRLQPLEAAPSGAAYAALILDAAALGAAQPALADLRLVDAGNDEVPYKLDVQRPESGRTSVPAAVLDLAQRGPVTTFRLDVQPGRFGPPPIHNAVTLDARSRNFRADVRIEASSDGRTWEVVRDRAVVFSVDADYKASHLSAAYPESSRRWLRLTVTPEAGGPLDIRGASVSRESSSPGLETEWRPVLAARAEVGKTTVWQIDMGFDNVPVTRLALATRDMNFQRPIRLSVTTRGPDGSDRPSEAWAGAVWRFALPGRFDESLSVQGTEVRGRAFRLEIDNGDNPPLKLDSLRFFGPRHVLRFPAGRPQPCRLYSGNPGARPPVYDLASFAGYASLGPGPAAAFADSWTQPNPAYAPADTRPWTEKHQGAFRTALALLCGFLIFMIAQKTREILRA